MCAVTAVGVEELVDERMLQGEQTLIDWQAATHVAVSEPEPAQPSTQSCERGPRCMDIPLDQWTSTLESVAGLVGPLEEGEVSQLKARLRSLDVGVLLSVQAFRSHGLQRLAKELREVLQHPPTNVT